jgi:subtilase family serine protease
MMRMVGRVLLSGAIALSFVAEFSSLSGAQPAPLIAQPVNNAQRITLVGNTRPEANLANDRGAVLDNFEMPHMLLQLKRSDALQQQLEQFAADVSNPSSPEHGQFLTGAQLAATYGPNPQDVQTITGWLRSQGFQVNTVNATANSIDFSGTAGQVRAAFGTQIHQLNVNGETYVANMNDPQIPIALANAVAGPVALGNFRFKPAFTQPRQSATVLYDVIPGDLYTVYNWTPLFGLGITGKGQTIGIMSESDTPGSTPTMFSTADWDMFRTTFNLNSPPFAGKATLTPFHPNNCSHSVGSDVLPEEADIDAQYSSAAAPDANILFVSCDAQFPGGIIAALTGTLELTSPPGVISVSYGMCEAQLGSMNMTINNLHLTAAVMGISVFVSSGDSLGAVCDGNDATFSTRGLSVNGLASTWWNVAVGGTDFMDTNLNQNSTYWNPTNRMTSDYLNWSSARSYIPEIPWNTSCASVLTASAYGFPMTYGPMGFCNSSQGNPTFLHSFPGTSAGTSTSYPVPLWQRPFVPAGTTHSVLNDVSMFASGGTPMATDPAGNGVWGHAYRLCYNKPMTSLVCSNNPTQWPGTDGTSVATPIWAGIQTLINQRVGRRQGLPTPTYYLLAGLAQIVHPGGGCNSSRPGGPSPTCVFNDVTQGDNDAPCQAGTPNCFAPGGSPLLGVLSTSTTSYQPAFKAGAGWDFSTGLGTPNVYNLVRAWPPLGGLGLGAESP